MPKSRDVVKILAVNALVLGAGIVLVELLFGTWFQDASALYQFTQARNTHIVQNNPLPGTVGTITYTRDEHGFRGLDGPVSNIDIITVGGSTTDQRYLDDGATYQAIMGAKFAAEGRKLSIANAGIDGQSTIGHAKIFASWFDKVPGLHSKYILYYVGINDLLRLEADKSYDVMAASSPALRAQLYIRDKSVFYQLYLIAKQLRTPHPYVHSINREFIAVGPGLVDKPLVENFATPTMQSSLENLKARIRDIAAQTRAHGSQSIFVTQRSARWVRRGGTVYGVATYKTDVPDEFPSFGAVNGVDIYHFEALVAGAIMEACRAADAICVDLMQDIDFDLETDFYDPIHTTASGAAKIGTYLHAALRGKI